MFVVFVGTIVTAILYVQALAGHGEAPSGFILAVTVWLLFTVLFANFAESAGRRPQPRSGGIAARHAPNRARKEARGFRRSHSRTTSQRQGGGPAQGRRRPNRGRGRDPGRRRSHRGRRFGRRKRDYRRVGAGHPRIGRRLHLGDGRHPGALRLDRRAGFSQSGRDVSRSHDFDGRIGEAAEDAERDRADDPAGRLDAGVPRGHRLTAAVFAVQRRSQQSGQSRDDHRAGRRCSSA